MSTSIPHTGSVADFAVERLCSCAPVSTTGSVADGTRAVAQGQGRDRPLLIDSVEVTRAKVGDWVYTSGVEQSPFPKDLKIGKVTKVDTVPGQGTTLEVEPLADLSSVYVKVVLKDPPK